MTLRLPHQHDGAAGEIVAMPCVLVQLGPERVRLVHDPAVVDDQDGLAAPKRARRERADPVNG